MAVFRRNGAEVSENLVRAVEIDDAPSSSQRTSLAPREAPGTSHSREHLACLARPLGYPHFITPRSHKFMHGQ